MTMHERNRLIEQYMSGEMSIREEEAFHLLVQTDDRLRHMLEAERLIRSAMASGRSRIPTDHSRMRTDALRLVAATPAANPAAAPAGPGTSKPGLFSGATGIAVVATCVILILGAFIFRAAVREPRKATPLQPAVMQPGARQEPAPPQHVQPVSPAQAVPADSTLEQQPMPRPQKRTRSPKLKQAAKREIIQENAPEFHEENHLPVILRNDTLRARLNIEQLKQR